MTRLRFASLSLGLYATTALVAAGTGYSAMAEPAEPLRIATYEEIIVSARKRDERLQEVPESLTVFGAPQIERANIESIRDFADMTPNLLIRETFRTNETFLSMRGISSAQGGLPPVSIIVDGVQVGSNDFLTQDLLDIERIEVLKGPQGALYGQGAIAGAINIITKQSGNDLEGMIKGSYGNANSYRIAGVVGGAVVDDTLFFRVASQYRSTDGLIRNQRGERVTFSDQGLVRGSLSYRGENLQVRLRGSWAEGDGSCCILDRAVPLPNRPAGRFLYEDIDDVKNPGSSASIIGTDDTRFRDVSLKVDYDLGGVSLTSITGWADVLQVLSGDSDYSSNPVTLGGVLYPDGSRQDISYGTEVWTQELRLASNDDGPFDWIIGGFYADRKRATRVEVGPLMPDGTLNPLNANQDFLNNSESWSLFGHASYDITDALELAVSLRYDEDKQDSQNLLAANTFVDAKFHKVQPKAQLSYQWSEDVLLYATYSTGFRSGGFTQAVKFENETTKNYEAGFKSSFADGMITLNGSFFHTDYSNQLLSLVVFDPQGATLVRTLNIPMAKIDGFEMEMTARLSDNLTVNVGVGVVDSVIKEVLDDPNLTGEEFSVGNKSPLVPPFTFNSSFTYTQPLANSMDLVLFGSYQRRGGFYFDPSNDMRTGTKDFIDGKISVETERWSLGIWAKNLTDTRHATYMSLTGSGLRNPNQPRSYGVEASFRF